MKKRYKGIRGVLIALFLLTNLTSVFSQGKEEQIDKLLKAYTNYGQFSGAVLVADQGKVLYKKGHGVANREWDVANTVDTKFRIGSLTKQFTSMLVMQQVEQGILELEKPIIDYLPEYPQEPGSEITLHHLLSHTSGVPNYTSFPIYREYMKRAFSPKELVKVFADSTLEFSPGEQYNYSNSNYVLLGHILETVANQSFEDLLKNNILKPLEITSTGFDHHGEVLGKRALGYFTTLTKARHADYIDMSVAYAAGAMYSTVEDLYKWDRALYSDELLSKEYRDKMFAPHADAGRFGYGYGWAMGDMKIGQDKNVFVVHHSGGINGFTSLITRFPNDDKLIVLSANIATDQLENITQAIAKVIYDLSFEQPKKPMALAISEWMDVNKPKQVLKLYNQHKEDNTFAPLNEFDMNMLGYDYLWSHQMEKALAIFEINVQAFPNSANVYDSYGEALIYNGDRKASIKNYEKSLELDPNNKGAIAMLKRMGVVYEPEQVELSINLLQSYVGTYQLMPSFQIVITQEGKKLFGQATGQQKLELLPKTENRFIAKGIDAEVVFNAVPNGEIVSSLTLIQGGSNEQIGKKVN